MYQAFFRLTSSCRQNGRQVAKLSYFGHIKAPLVFPILALSSTCHSHGHQITSSSPPFSSSLSASQPAPAAVAAAFSSPRGELRLGLTALALPSLRLFDLLHRVPQESARCPTLAFLPRYQQPFLSSRASSVPAALLPSFLPSHGAGSFHTAKHRTRSYPD